MYFEAELKNIKYQINISTDDESWQIQLRQEGQEEWENHCISMDDFREADDIISFIFENKSYLMDVQTNGLDCDVYTRGSYRSVKIYNDEMLLHESLKSGGLGGDSKSLNSGMPGKIVKVFVKEGQEVKQGESLLVMEAMKMENEMKAAADVTVSKVHVKPGDNVEAGSTLISF